MTMEPSQIRSLLERWPYSSVTPPFIWLFRHLANADAESIAEDARSRGTARRRRSGVRALRGEAPEKPTADANETVVIPLIRSGPNDAAIANPRDRDRSMSVNG